MNPVPLGALNQIAPLADALIAGARVAGAPARKVKHARRPSSPYATLRPGPSTPLWNQLVTAIEKTLGRRGEKARLARYLGISRQRLNMLVVARSACPDAERTLQLLAWLRASQSGASLG